MGGSKSKGGAPPAPIAAPIAPTVANAKVDAKAEAEKRRRISVLRGGVTNLTADNPLNQNIASGAGSVGSKTLLGS